MKKFIIIIALCLLCAYNVVSSENNTRKVAGPDYIEINCMLSGGMKRVTFKNHVFIFAQTFPKKRKKDVFESMSGDLSSFVEIQKKTKNPQLQKAFKELFGIAKEFTATE